MKQTILTVVGKDHPGIIATVTGILFRYGCNLEDISMTILEGQLAMMLVFSSNPRQRARLEQAFGKLPQKKDLSFFWKDAKAELKRGEKHQRGSVPYLISAFGRDRTGIVFKASDYLARQKINITDLNSRILGQGKNALYMMLLEADVPKNVKPERLAEGLKRLAKSLGVEIQLKPVEPIEI